MLSNLRFEHEEALHRERNIGIKDTTPLVHRHGQELANCREHFQNTINVLEEKLEDALDLADEAKRQAREHQEALWASNIQHEETKSAVLECQEMMEFLRTTLDQTLAECEAAKADSAQFKDRFQQKELECAGLTSKIASNDKDQQSAAESYEGTISTLQQDLRRSTQASGAQIAELKASHEEQLRASECEFIEREKRFAGQIDSQCDQNAILQQQLLEAEDLLEVRAFSLREVSHPAFIEIDTLAY